MVEVRAGRKGTALPEATTPHHSLAPVVVVVATVAEQQARLRSRRKRGAAPVGTIRMAGAVAQADLPREAERRVLWVVAAAVVAARPTEEPGAQADQVSILMPRMDLGAAPHNREKEARELPSAAVGAARVPVASVERPEPRAPERRASLSFAIPRDLELHPYGRAKSANFRLRCPLTEQKWAYQISPAAVHSPRFVSNCRALVNSLSREVVTRQSVQEARCSLGQFLPIKSIIYALACDRIGINNN